MYYSLEILGHGGEKNRSFANRWRLPFSENHSYDYDDKFYDSDLSLKKVELDEDSTEVDFIFGTVELGGQGFFLSERILEIFEKYELPKYEVLEVDVELPSKKLTNQKYFWFHVIYDDKSKFIDFQKSEIISDKGIKVNSLEEYEDITLDFSKEYKSIVLHDGFLDSGGLDLISIEGRIHPLISKKLKEALEVYKATGVEFIESPVFYYKKS